MFRLGSYHFELVLAVPRYTSESAIILNVIGDLKEILYCEMVNSKYLYDGPRILNLDNIIGALEKKKQKKFLM